MRGMRLGAVSLFGIAVLRRSFALEGNRRRVTGKKVEEKKKEDGKSRLPSKSRLWGATKREKRREGTKLP